jgi:uncharacterized protein (TIGR03089 family)
LHPLIPATPEQFFGELVVERPSQPFVTYYDEASGERTELSVRSLGNWVAKTHFLLLDELGLGPGDAAYLALPAHWISVPIVLGCLTAGLELRTASPDGADVAFVVPDHEADGVADVFAVAPDSAAVGFRDGPPAGAQDYVLAVRPQADKWATVQLRGTAADPCLDGATRAEVVAAARSTGLPDGARVLSTRQWASGQDLIDTLLAPLVARGSVVLVRNADAALVDRRSEQERVTVRADG